MPNLKYAKPKEKLLNAPLDIQYAMEDYTNYLTLESKLHGDIGERFNYPSLRVAIATLLEFRKQWVIAHTKLINAGYTSDDACMLAEYENEDD